MFRQFYPTAFAFAALDIAKLDKPVYHLHQMMSGNGVIRSDFLHTRKPAWAGSQVHQAP